MLDQCSIEERWAGVSQIIERWLEERQDLIVQFCGVSGVHEYSPKTAHSALRLQNFCQVLVDYMSAGHFEVYYELIREAEAFEDGSVEEGKRILAKIQDTTDLALAFNDTYANSTEESALEVLPKALSTLGETLAARFELEDQLIAVIHEAHREQVA